MRHVVVGTAGHIDHGKSSLVRALTGIDPDRLAEEKARGITIDLGFAHLDLGDLRIGFVDVPGHEKFVRNMLAGAAGFDVMLLVVAADESVMPQTVEHLSICRLLGVTAAVVALTRVDLVDDPDLVELVGLEVADALAGGPLEDAPILPVSSASGEGLGRLRTALVEAADRAPRRDPEGPFRLPVDRVFSVRGFGAVVTGTLVSGRVRAGDEVAVLPGGGRARVRGVQVHGSPVEGASVGQRAALNLAGASRIDVARGSVVAAPDALRATRMLDADLEVVDWASAPVADEARVHLHLGAAAVLARVRLLGGRRALPPGGTAPAQLRLESPLVAARGDRFIIRRYSPVVTIGGGLVLDALPPKRSPRSEGQLRAVEALRAGPTDVGLRFLEEAGPSGMTPEDLARRLGLASAAGVVRTLVEAGEADDGDVLLATSATRLLEERLLARLARLEREHRLRAGMGVEELRERLGVAAATADRILHGLRRAGRIEIAGGAVRTAGREVELTPAERAVLDGYAALLAESGLKPPTLSDAARTVGASVALLDALRRLLVADGRAVAVSPDLHFDAAAIEGLRRTLAERAGAEIDVAWFKERFGLSRKRAIPLLEWLDRERVTLRVGNVRRIRS